VTYHRGDGEKIGQLQRKRAEVIDGLTRAEALWLAALERLEAAGDRA
jgi:ATP-binding cassette subfamily F protein 3